MRNDILRFGYRMIIGIPAARFIPDLHSFYGEGDEDARTGRPNGLACGAGWMALGFGDTLDEFKARLGMPQGSLCATPVFSVRGSSIFDSWWDTRGLNDKQLVLFRILRQCGLSAGDARAQLRQDLRKLEEAA